jgi:spore germination protein GerM
MNCRWWFPVAAALAIAGCSIDASSSPTAIDDGAVPFDLLDPDAPALAPVAQGQSVTVCLLRDGRLALVQRTIDEDASFADILQATANTTRAEAAAGLDTAIGGAEEIADVTVTNGIAAVDFEPTAAESLTADPLATIAQLVCTLTEQRGIGSVRFTLDGMAIDVPTADGSLTDAPVGRDDYASLLDTA